MMINEKRLLDNFLMYLRIDSESTNEKAIACRLVSDLKAIGCQIYVDHTQQQTGCNTGNIYATLPGTTIGDPILFCAHMDTVTPGVGIQPIITNGIIRSEGNTILGGDDKSGIAAIIEALRTIVEQNLPHPTIQVVFTVAEEIGLRGSRYLEYQRLLAKQAVVLDSSGDAGQIITSAPGQVSLKATIIGRRAHAGVAPEEGISAIEVMAHAIANMKLLRIDNETTANIGSIFANYATNIVPEQAELTGEARSLNEQKLQTQSQHMVDCLQQACKQFGATLQYQLTKAYAAYKYAETDPFVQYLVTACQKAGLKPVLGSSGGGSDANNLNANNMKALVLGTGMSKVHTTEEEITVQNLNDTAKLTLTLMTM